MLEEISRFMRQPRFVCVCMCVCVCVCVRARAGEGGVGGVYTFQLLNQLYDSKEL